MTVAFKEPSKAEIAGFYKASDKGGEFLDGLGKTDLADLSKEEWLEFIEIIVRHFEYERDEVICLSDEIPF